MNVLIVDGGSGTCPHLQQLAADLKDCQLIPAGNSTAETLEQLEALHPDVLLLPARLEDKAQDSLQIVHHLADRTFAPAIVLCIEQDDPARFLLESLYPTCLVTPTDAQALLHAVQHAQRLAPEQLAALPQHLPRTYLSAKTHKGIERVPVDQVLYLMADHKYVTLYHEDGELLLDDSLKALEDEFGGQLVRIHRHTLVSRRRMERLQRTSQGGFMLYLQGVEGQGLAVSRRQLPFIRSLMPEGSAR